MNGPALLVWPMAWIAITGALITAALAVPTAQSHLGTRILGAVVLGGLLAVPVSLSASKAMRS